MIRYDIPMSRGFHLVLIEDAGAIVARLRQAQASPKPPMFTTRKVPFLLDDLEALALRDKYKAGPRGLELTIDRTTACAMVGGVLQAWSQRRAFVKELWDFICDVKGVKTPIPGSIEEVWDGMKKFGPFATRVEDDNGARMHAPPPPEPRRGDYRIRRRAIDPKDGEVKVGTFSGRTFGEAEQAYYRHIRRYGRPDAG